MGPRLRLHNSWSSVQAVSVNRSNCDEEMQERDSLRELREHLMSLEVGVHTEALVNSGVEGFLLYLHSWLLADNVFQNNLQKCTVVCFQGIYILLDSERWVCNLHFKK